MAVEVGKKYSLGELELETGKRLLTRGGQPVPLAHRPFQVLVHLIENRERLVTRQELLDLFWEGRDVYDLTLSRCVSSIRKALDDQSDRPRFIETRWAEGYRFIGPAEESALIPETSIIEVEKTRGVRIIVEDDGEDDAAFAHAKVLPVEAATQVSTKLLNPAPSKRRTWLVKSLLAGGVFAVIVGGFLIYRSHNKAAASRPLTIHTLAVLPLENLSGDPAQDYFADGMTEELITEMAKIGALRVISRTSVMQFKGARKPLPEIARELHVDGIVQGAVNRSSGRVRITAQLINAATDQHVWAESYERDLGDMLSLQRDVARGIANQINVTLSLQEQTLLAGKPPVNAAANEAYLKGLYYFNEERNAKSFDERKQFFLKSVEFYEQAIKLQPDYPGAYAALARANHWMGLAYYTQAIDAAKKALQLDDTLAEAHGALAYATFGRDWDWSGAEREYRRAIELNPSYSEAHHGYALYLSAAGRSAEAITEIKRAVELDPLEIPTKHNLARIYLEAHKYNEAQEAIQTILDMRPDDPYTHFLRGIVLTRKGVYEEAVAELQKSLNLGGEDASVESMIALTYAESGKRELAFKQLNKVNGVLKVSHYNPGLPILIATVYSVLGEKEEAFRELSRAYDAHAPGLLYIRTYPEFDSLRSDARFGDLLRRIGFPQSA